MNWRPAVLKVILLCCLVVALGWYYDLALPALSLTMAGVIAFWLYQMHRVQAWLEDPGQVLPEVYGIWAEILAKVHRLQRLNDESQEQLQATVDYFRDSFAAMNDGVVLVDRHGTIAWLNRAAQSLVDLRFPQDQGQSLTNLIRVPEFISYFMQETHDRPLQFSSAQEPPRFLEVDVTHFGDGERLLFIRDITAKKRLEKIRSDFVANVSHELRTPLTVITGYLATFLDSGDQLPQGHLAGIRQMAQQAERMEGLLKDLLELSRIESEEQTERGAVVDVPALLRELCDDLQFAHPDVQLNRQITCADTVYGDYRELYSAVMNLLQNAVKYGAPGSPITVRWHREANSCHLDICDRGVGIDALHIPRLTERFYRVDDSRSASTGGTGLGLAIVKHVAAAHDARLEINSIPGEGSVFTLIFPIGEQNNGATG